MYSKMAGEKTNYGIVPSKLSHFYLTELTKPYQVTSSKFIFSPENAKIRVLYGPESYPS